MAFDICKYERYILEIISHAGSARSLLRMALIESKKSSVVSDEIIKEKLKEADMELSKAHEVQTQLIHLEAQGKNIEITMLLVHAQDILMTALSERDLVGEIIELQRNLAAMKDDPDK